VSAQGWLYPIPTSTKKLLIRYSPTWLISCLLPEGEREISIKCLSSERSGKLSIKVPSLLLSHFFNPPWATQSFDPPQEIFYINSIRLPITDYIVKPYRLSNVYPNSAMCYGSSTPNNLRQANSILGESTFTDDGSLFYDEHDKVCSIKVHDYFGHISQFKCPCACCWDVCGCRCDCDLEHLYFKWVQNYPKSSSAKEINRTLFFKGNSHLEFDEPSSYIFLSNILGLTSIKNYYKSREASFLLGLATWQDSEWKITTENATLTFHKNQLISI